jgi:hypothetical protein
MAAERDDGPGRSVWQNRGLRLATGLNVAVAVALAAVIAVTVNYLSSRYYARWDLSTTGFYRLSDRTLSLLGSLRTRIDIVAFLGPEHELRQDVVNLLREYEYAADALDGLRLRVTVVDPNRDLAWTRELAAKYDVHSPNVIVVESDGRRKYVEAAEMAEYDVKLTPQRGIERKKRAFRGEQVLSSAIQTVAQERRPRVLFLTGHGERDIEDFNRVSGYSSVARLLRRDNVEVQRLVLAESGGVPEDCSALVVAGPDRQLSRIEADMLGAYLERNGRMFLLADPAMQTGLEGLLAKWGVELGPHVVVGLTLSGRELVVTEYGQHPITRNLSRVTTMFYMPRSVLPLAAAGEPGAAAQEDRPRVTALAANTADGWAETDLSQSPPRFDADADRRGPVPVAVAVERGAVQGVRTEIRPTRLVIVGDSDFVSNGALASGMGGNKDFFLSALNWLVEREEMMAVAPKIPTELRLDMGPRRMRAAFLLIVAAPAAAAALVGLIVRQQRKY